MTDRLKRQDRQRRLMRRLIKTMLKKRAE